MPHPLFHLLGRWLLALALLSMLGSVLGLAGERWWWCDLFSHFRPQYVAILIPAALLVALQRRVLCTAVFALAATLNVWIVAPSYAHGWWGARHPAALRVVVLNLGVHNRRADLVLPFLRASGAEVIVLLELTTFWRDALEPLHAAYPERVEAPGDGPFGIALLARGRCEPCTLDASHGTPSIDAVLHWQGRQVSLLALHPPPPINAELSSARDRTLRAAARQLAERSGPRILAGDLNTTPWSFLYGELLRAGVRDGGRTLASWPAWLPWPALPIDHVLVSEELAVTDKRRGPRVGSDHRPIVVDLAFTGR